MSQYEVLQETLQRMADMAIWMEDEPSMHLGKSYSVNLNFRRDGQRLYVSIESYGNVHAGNSEEFIIPLLRKYRSRRIALDLILGNLPIIAAALLTAVIMTVMK